MFFEILLFKKQPSRIYEDIRQVFYMLILISKYLHPIIYKLLLYFVFSSNILDIKKILLGVDFYKLNLINKHFYL